MNDNLELMRSRLEFCGGVSQQARMIKNKRETLDRVVLYSYQGAQVKKIDDDTIAPALINPNVTKQDYDDKIISIGYEYNFTPGSIFEWVNTGTYWLIYLQDLTELAYFKGDVRRCRYQIKWQDSAGNTKITYAAIKGPSQKSLSTIYKSDNAIDLPNYTLDLLLPQTPEVMEHFSRYTEFYLQGSDICWRVEATDSISTPGILELTAKEYYSNLAEDDVEKGIVGGLIEEVPEPEPQTEMIAGEVFIRPKKTYEYTYTGNENGEWSFTPSSLPIKYEVKDKTISIKWDSTYRGQFILKYANEEKTIVVESLF